MINPSEKIYKLPSPCYDSDISIEHALFNRRSRRNYKPDPLSIDEVSQILWAAYGITFGGSLKTAPSAGACYPLEIYLIAGKVKELPEGLYKYLPREHDIIKISSKDLRSELSSAALHETMILEAPACLVYTAVVERNIFRYGERGKRRYIPMDIGHSAQNVYLQAVALNLGTCAIGAFEDEKVRKVLNVSDEEEPMYIMPFGYFNP